MADQNFLVVNVENPIVKGVLLQATHSGLLDRMPVFIPVVHLAFEVALQKHRFQVFLRLD